MLFPPCPLTARDRHQGKLIPPVKRGMEVQKFSNLKLLGFRGPTPSDRRMGQWSEREEVICDSWLFGNRLIQS